MFFQATYISFENSICNNNFAASRGGCLMTTTTIINFKRSSIVFNSAESFGGGLYAKEGNNIRLEGSTFDSNYVVDGSGGGAYIETSNAIESSPLNIMSCNFINNTAQGSAYSSVGGALYLKDIFNLQIDKSLFNLNKVTNSGPLVIRSVSGGGAVFFDSSTVRSVKITDSSFINNLAAAGRGGAILQTGSVDNLIINTIIHDCIFTANAALAGPGGAIFWFRNALASNPDINEPLIDNMKLSSSPSALLSLKSQGMNSAIYGPFIASSNTKLIVTRKATYSEVSDQAFGKNVTVAVCDTYNQTNLMENSVKISLVVDISSYKRWVSNYAVGDVNSVTFSGEATFGTLGINNIPGENAAITFFSDPLTSVRMEFGTRLCTRGGKVYVRIMIQKYLKLIPNYLLIL